MRGNPLCKRIYMLLRAFQWACVVQSRCVSMTKLSYKQRWRFGLLHKILKNTVAVNLKITLVECLRHFSECTTVGEWKVNISGCSWNKNHCVLHNKCILQYGTWGYCSTWIISNVWQHLWGLNAHIEYVLQETGPQKWKVDFPTNAMKSYFWNETLHFRCFSQALGKF